MNSANLHTINQTQTSRHYSNPSAHNSFSIPDTSYSLNSTERQSSESVSVLFILVFVDRRTQAVRRWQLPEWSLKCDAPHGADITSINLNYYSQNKQSHSNSFITTFFYCFTKKQAHTNLLLLKNGNKKLNKIRELIAKIWKDASSIATESGAFSEKVKLDYIVFFSFSEELQIQQYIIYCLSWLLDLLRSSSLSPHYNIRQRCLDERVARPSRVLCPQSISGAEKTFCLCQEAVWYFSCCSAHIKCC